MHFGAEPGQRGFAVPESGPGEGRPCVASAARGCYSPRGERRRRGPRESNNSSEYGARHYGECGGAVWRIFVDPGQQSCDGTRALRPPRLAHLRV